MNKEGPTLGRILTMVGFTLSCFGLLLFLWLSFGGAIPLQPKGYRFKVAVPEATQLALQADVRISGVSVGKVVQKELDPKGNRTLATIEVQRQFAPLHKDARAILREKTLLGESYLELTPGSRSAPDLPDGGRLANAHVKHTVQLDEIYDALNPQTRKAFQDWQSNTAKAIQGNSQNLNDVFGNLPQFAASADDVLTVLDTEHVAVRGVVRDTGRVFAALAKDPQQLRNLVTASDAVFRQTAQRNRELAETFRVFPTFLDETKTTMARLQSFSRTTDPLIRDLRPVARDLVPTVRDVRRLAPYLRTLFVNLGPLITASKKGLPATRKILEGARPLLGQLGPFLSQLNPILQYLELNQHLVADFISVGAGGVASKTQSATGGIGHYLRQFNPLGQESFGFTAQQRVSYNRSNPYIPPLGLASSQAAKYLFPTPSWDCKNTPSGGPQLPVESSNPAVKQPGCFTIPSQTFQGKALKFPHIGPNSYAKKK